VAARRAPAPPATPPRAARRPRPGTDLRTGDGSDAAASHTDPRSASTRALQDDRQWPSHASAPVETAHVAPPLGGPCTCKILTGIPAKSDTSTPSSIPLVMLTLVLRPGFSEAGVVVVLFFQSPVQTAYAAGWLRRTWSATTSGKHSKPCSCQSRPVHGVV